MTQHFTDFSEYAVGAQPADWTSRFVTSGVTYSVESSGMPSGPVGGQALLIHKTTQSRHLITWDTIGSVADVEIVARWARMSAVPTTSVLAGGAGRASGAAASETLYTEAPEPDGTYGIRKYASGVQQFLSAVADYAPAIGAWNWSRLRISGTTIQAKQWLDGAPEPGGWTGSVTDSTITVAGWVGFLTFAKNASTATAYFLDVFGVGTGGDAAPTAPVSTAGQPVALRRGGFVLPRIGRGF